MGQIKLPIRHSQPISHTLFQPILVFLRLIPALYFTPTMNDILRLDPSSKENYDVSFAPHKTKENTTTVFGIYQKLSLKMRRNPFK